MNLHQTTQHYCHDYEQGKFPQPPPLEQRNFRNLRQETLAFLASDTATQMLQQDVYWPKWDSPWWHILALKEAGALHEVPHSFLDALLQQADQQYIKSFPLTEAELPEGCNPYRDILCFCALGTLWQLPNSQAYLAWAENWFERYQLPDGGYNCDEQAYLKQPPRSSFVSSLPMYEALLQQPHLTPAQQALLGAGSRYLQQREFCKSLSKQQVADASWLTPMLPLFYDYDVIRGMQFVLNSHLQWGTSLDLESFAFAFTQVHQQLSAPETVFRSPLNTENFSWRFQGQTWAKGKSTSFSLLDWLCQPEIQRAFVHQRFYRLCQDLLQVIATVG